LFYSHGLGIHARGFAMSPTNTIFGVPRGFIVKVRSPLTKGGLDYGPFLLDATSLPKNRLYVYDEDGQLILDDPPDRYARRREFPRHLAKPQPWKLSCHMARAQGSLA